MISRTLQRSLQEMKKHCSKVESLARNELTGYNNDQQKCQFFRLTLMANKNTSYSK